MHKLIRNDKFQCAAPFQRMDITILDGITVQNTFETRYFSKHPVSVCIHFLFFNSCNLKLLLSQSKFYFEIHVVLNKLQELVVYVQLNQIDTS